MARRVTDNQLVRRSNPSGSVFPSISDFCKRRWHLFGKRRLESTAVDCEIFFCEFGCCTNLSVSDFWSHICADFRGSELQRSKARCRQTAPDQLQHEKLEAMEAREASQASAGTIVRRPYCVVHVCSKHVRSGSKDARSLSHLDLFPVRQSTQAHGIFAREPLILTFKILELTQWKIHLRPRLIQFIEANTFIEYLYFYIFGLTRFKRYVFWYMWDIRIEFFEDTAIRNCY